MTAWLARRTLRLYPMAYRRRYGDEMLALLEDRPPRGRTVLDLLRGALLAHLRPGDAPAGAVDPSDRLRATASGVLLCWVFFAAAGFGFYKSTEDQPFSVAGQTHPLLRDAHLAVQALALAASVMIVLGALPLIAVAVRQARQAPSLRRAVVLPFVPVVVFALLTAGFVVLAHADGSHHASGSPHPAALGYGAAVVWAVASLGCGVACVLACRAALFATPLPPERLRAALAAATFVTALMLAITAAAALYGVALAADASQLAGAPTGPFGLITTANAVLGQVVVMMAAGALAATTTLRGWRALH